MWSLCAQKAMVESRESWIRRLSKEIVMIYEREGSEDIEQNSQNFSDPIHKK